ncbi:MAG: ATP-binding protein [Lentisphaeria bacterium]|jgi:MinD superfamily P-loop ATPase
MILAIASGKGGTGKTSVAVALAQAATGKVQYVDCDVEAPNGHLFLHPAITERREACLPVPAVDAARCTGCGECARFCQYNALAALGTNVLTFPELCHGCGGCAKLCPAGAIREVPRRIGVVESGQAGTVRVTQGRLDVGHPAAPPLIRAVKRQAGADGLAILDCPPGTACPVVAAVRGCDALLLVTEPTPFGRHDLTLAVALARGLRLPLAVAINRCDTGDRQTEAYCRAEGLPVLLRLPDDRRVAEAYSRGEGMLAARPEWARLFRQLPAAMATLGQGGAP